MISLFKPEIKMFVENYSNSISAKALSAVKSGKSKFIFNGPAGTGKNFLAEAIANELKAAFEVINLYELSDDTQSVSSLILESIKRSAVSKSLFQPDRKVIYIEDMEKLLSVDPSIAQKINSIGGNSIIIFESETGEIFRGKYKKYLSGYEMIRFYKLNNRVLKAFAVKLVLYNKMRINESLIDSIVMGAKGNLSSIITDLDTVSITNAAHMDTFRNSDDSIFDKITSVFAGKVENTEIYFASDMEAKNFEIWLAEKAPQVLKKEELYHFFESLSTADIVLNKIKKQNWALLKYVKNIMVYSCYGFKVSFPRVDFYAPKWDSYYR
ncbi:MAG: AAA family ATPase [Candidatus Parvarchaeota archaeon]|jgi:DNA polymerase III delta prime subunit|nr:AAA family ATPase [Candidatus Parvarchaeota archaeon]MCL5107166.1 AAA family ATPase [Candidatus Parvarchaeota archaeon]